MLRSYGSALGLQAKIGQINAVRDSLNKRGLEHEHKSWLKTSCFLKVFKHGLFRGFAGKFTS